MPETPEQKIARYERALRAMADCCLVGIEYGDYIQATVDTVLEGDEADCWNCGTTVHEGPCVAEAEDDSK